MLKSVCQFATLLFCLFAWLPASSADEKTTLEAVITRQKQLQNVTVVYEETQTRHPSQELRTEPVRKNDDAEELLGVAIGSFRRLNAQFLFREGQVRYEEQTAVQVSPDAQEVSGDSLIPYLTFCRSRSRDEQYWKHDFGVLRDAVISGHESLPQDSVIDRALGLRGLNSDYWLEPEQWRKFSQETTPEGNLRVRFKPTDERFQGQFEHVWTFSPEYGHALIQHQAVWRGKVDQELTCRDFRQVGPLKLPHRIEQRRFYNEAGKEPRLTESHQIRVKSYDLDAIPEGETPFRMTWPDGAVVLVKSKDRELVVRNGPRVIADEELKALSAKDQP